MLSQEYPKCSNWKIRWFYDPPFTETEMPAPRFKENGIVPNKLGHLALGSVHPLKTAQFYQEVLNFHYTDRIDERAQFPYM